MRHRATHTAALASALGLAAMMAGAPALAGEYGTELPQPQQQDTAQISDTKLDQFVDALNEVHTIREEAVVELEAAPDTEAANEVQQRAQQLMIEAVERNGLSVEEYNQIATRMGTDPELQARISAKLDERS